jgi:hypothetical protein
MQNDEVYRDGRDGHSSNNPKGETVTRNIK